MRRRLTLAMVGVVTFALLVAGAATLVLVRRAARQEARRDLVVQARDIAEQAADPTAFRALATAARALRLEGISRVAVTRAGAVEGTLPDGVSVADLRLDDLATGREVSGTHGSLVYAVVGVRAPAAAARPARRTGYLAVVLTRRADPGLGRGAGWLLVSSVAALALAAVVAETLARRVAAPLRAAEETTRRISGGDLEARVAVGEADAELASLGASINAMAENLQRARGLERQFLLAVSHDLRTPLTSIRGFAEAIADGAAPDSTSAASVIAAEARRLERLVADLLELAKLDARHFSLDVRTVDVAEVVAVTAGAFEPEIAELGLRLDVDAPRPVPGRVDPDRLAQIVANLVENALKYAASVIRVTVHDVGSDVVVVVDDDGPGIAGDDLPHVFERLYTSARTPARRSGTGLGLAIVAELATAMRGSVAARSSAGGGTRLEVRLPAAS